MRSLLLAALTFIACTPFSAVEAVEAVGAVEGGAPVSDAPQPADASTSPPALALDTFSRAVASGFGTAEVGGTWSRDGTVNVVSVDEGTGNVLMKAGATTTMHLPSVAALDVDEHLTTSSDRFGSGSSSPYIALVARKSATRSYGCTARVLTDGKLNLTIGRDAAGDTVRATSTAIVMEAGELFHIRFIVRGANPTRLQCKAWKAPSREPAEWHLDVSDATAEIQVGGGVGVRFYLSEGSVDTLLHIDEFVVRAPSP